MIKQAFNTLARLHSRPATLKRFGTPDIYSPIRITPSNYFRFLEGPGSTTIHGREFVIPVSTMLGNATQLITFGEAPVAGDYILTYDSVDSAEIAFNDNAAAVQSKLRAVTGLSYVTVTGNLSDGFLVTFVGVDSPETLIPSMGVTPLTDVNDEEVEITVAQSDYVAWDDKIKRGDKIVDSIFGSIAVDEIIEINDLGGGIMGYRVRCE